jgi:hypothetical protein
MSTCTTERWIDRVDAYGYARQAGLKTAYVAVIFFLVNAFWKAPPLAVLTMCVAGAGIVLIEMPSINSPKKKDLSYIVFTLLTIITVSVFRFFSYFTLLEVVAIVGWCYVLYRLVASDPEKAQVVAIAILIGFVSLEAPGATDFWAWVNQTAFYMQFAVIAFVAHKLYPNRYQRVVKNIMRQIWLLQHQQLEPQTSFDRTYFAGRFIKHLSALEQVQPLLSASTRDQIPRLVDALWQYQQGIDQVMHHGSDAQRQSTRQTHNELLLRLSDLKHRPESSLTDDDSSHPSDAITRLSRTWDRICQEY